MHVLSWRDVDLAGVVLAGLIAGYVMAIAGLWAGKVPGLVAVDIADVGRRYLVSDRPSAWFFGLTSHLVNSVIFTLVWAMAVLPNVSLPRPLLGVLWGEALAVAFAGALIAPMSGLGFLGHRTRSPRFALTSLLLHGLWGALIGLLYVRP